MLIENIGFITLKIQMMLKAAMQVRKFERRYKKADKNLARVKNTELKKKTKTKNLLPLRSVSEFTRQRI